MVETGLIGWSDVARVMSETPARIGRLAGQGIALAAGAPAEVTLYDPSASAEFDVDRLAGRSVNSPYLGLRLPGRVVATVHAGYATLLDGALRPAEEVAAFAAASAEAARG
jgi:dihydroorotase